METKEIKQKRFEKLTYNSACMFIGSKFSWIINKDKRPICNIHECEMYCGYCVHKDKCMKLLEEMY